MTGHPSRIVDTGAGSGLYATADLPAGTEVALFEGPVLPYAQVRPEQVRYVLWIGPDEWLVPTTPARFINHSCEPSCEVDDLRVVTLRPVACGEELTFDYAGTSSLDPDGPDSFWDPRWSFSCRCGSPRCRGMVDGYVATSR